jgi:hypothetical protein
MTVTPSSAAVKCQGIVGRVPLGVEKTQHEDQGQRQQAGGLKGYPSQVPGECTNP